MRIVSKIVVQRHFRRVCGLLVCLIVLGLSTTEAQDRPHKRRKIIETPRDFPNLVIFLIDTLRADRLGVYGYDGRPTSPRIDELAKESVVFEQAYAPSPWTLPSVISLASGMYPSEHGTLDDRYGLFDKIRVFGDKLHEVRYRTMCLYTNAYSGPDFGLGRGFDVLQPLPYADGAAVSTLFDNYYRSPFYLFIHNIETHTPHSYAPETPEEGFREISNERRLEIKRLYGEYRSLTRVDFEADRPLGSTDNSAEQQACLKGLTDLKTDYSELYDAALRRADMRVGEVIDELKRRGAWDNTIFILLSDHGEEMNEHGGWLHDQSVYEELIHVPLIIRFPHDAFGGKRISDIVSLVDISPTLFQYLGYPKLARSPSGKDLMPLINGEQADQDPDFRVVSTRINTKKYYKPWKESRGDINIAVRRGHWKGIWNVEPDTLELYDLSTDPGESKNVSEENVPLKIAMRLFAKEFWERTTSRAARPTRREGPLNSETQENLRALGYLD